MGLMMRINIPKRGQKVTNGDIIKAIFPKIDKYFSNVMDLQLWWNAPYKEEKDGESE